MSETAKIEFFNRIGRISGDHVVAPNCERWEIVPSYRHVKPQSDPRPTAMLRIAESLSFKNALAMVDVRVLRHVIIGKGTPYWFAESGLL